MQFLEVYTVVLIPTAIKMSFPSKNRAKRYNKTIFSNIERNYCIFEQFCISTGLVILRNFLTDNHISM